jgi:hypothetical protein
VDDRDSDAWDAEGGVADDVVGQVEAATPALRRRGGFLRKTAKPTGERPIGAPATPPPEHGANASPPNGE